MSWRARDRPAPHLRRQVLADAQTLEDIVGKKRAGKLFTSWSRRRRRPRRRRPWTSTRAGGFSAGTGPATPPRPAATMPATPPRQPQRRRSPSHQPLGPTPRPTQLGLRSVTTGRGARCGRRETSARGFATARPATAGTAAALWDHIRDNEFLDWTLMPSSWPASRCWVKMPEGRRGLDRRGDRCLCCPNGPGLRIVGAFSSSRPRRRSVQGYRCGPLARLWASSAADPRA